MREEIQQDKDWVIRLRTLPERPETYYLMELMASHDFQTALQNYLDLEDLRKKCSTRGRAASMPSRTSFALRRQNYEPLLPTIDAQFRELDSQIRLRMEQREHLRRRLQAMLIAPRPELLATADERILIERISTRIEDGACTAADRSGSAEHSGAHPTPEGTAHLDAAHAVPRAPDAGAYSICASCNRTSTSLTAQYNAFVRDETGGSAQLRGLRRCRSTACGRVSASALEAVEHVDGAAGSADRDSCNRRAQGAAAALEVYQTQARYAVADSYDRATEAQAGGGDAECAALMALLVAPTLGFRLRAAERPDRAARSGQLHEVPADTRRTCGR